MLLSRYGFIGRLLTLVARLHAVQRSRKFHIIITTVLKAQRHAQRPRAILTGIQDYGVAKHAVLGLTRNLTANLSDTNIRANCIAPLWTATGIVPAQVMKDALGIESQPPEAVGRSVALLMTDTERKGQCIFSKRGMYKEIESGLLGAVFALTEPDSRDMPRDPESMKVFKNMFDSATERAGTVQ